MDTHKTRSLETIEAKMESLEEGSLRYKILLSAKNFKTSWVELGQSLYAVWKDKLFREWGYLTFEAYTAKEIGIRKQTALKLLKSYYFLEKEEPAYLEQKDSERVAQIPSYEAVDVLRQAKNKKDLDEGDYRKLRSDVFEGGKDVREVKKDLTALMRQREELDPDEAREKRRSDTVRRFVSTLKSLKRELEAGKLVPASVIKEASALIHKLELEVTNG